MAWNRSALHDVLAQGAFNRDITVFAFMSFLHTDMAQVFEILSQVRQELTYST